MKWRWPLCGTSAPMLPTIGACVGSQNSAWTLAGADVLDPVHVDALVHGHDARPAGSRRRARMAAIASGGRDEHRHLPVLPLRERVALQVEVHAPRGDERGRGLERRHRQAERCHRHAVRIVRVDDVRAYPVDEARQPPARLEIELVSRSERDELEPLRRAPAELAVGVGHEQRALAGRAQAHDGQQHLVLAAAPAGRRVDVDREHRDQTARRRARGLLAVRAASRASGARSRS